MSDLWGDDGWLEPSGEAAHPDDEGGLTGGDTPGGGDLTGGAVFDDGADAYAGDEPGYLPDPPPSVDPYPDVDLYGDEAYPDGLPGTPEPGVAAHDDGPFDARWWEPSDGDGAAYPPTAPPVGADPDLVGEAAPGEDGWQADFPAPLRFGPDLEPVDGPPWADPDLLGDTGVDPTPVAGGAGTAPAAADLAGYAGVALPPDADPWQVLAASDDPATSALARFWAPPGPAADPPSPHA